jgi:hypothetical protein
VARLLGFGVLLFAVSIGLAVFSAYPWEASSPGAALLRIAFKHVAAPEQAARPLSPAELEKLPAHMRPLTAERAATGRRRDTSLVATVDGRTVLDRTYRPSGLRHDGPTFGHEELAVSPGRHRIEITFAETGGGEGEPRRWSLAQDVVVRPGQVLLVELTGDAGVTLR